MTATGGMDRSTSGPPVATPFFYGWIIVACAAVAGLMSGPGQTYGMSLLVAQMRAELGWSAGLVSALYTAGSLCAAPSLLVTGRLLDRHGGRVMLVAVSLLLALAATAMSGVHEPWQALLLFFALRALGQGGLTLIPPVLIAQWFVIRRPRALAVQRLGMAASQGVFPVAAHTLAGALGWRSAWVGFGAALVALVALPAGMLVRRSPEAVGLTPDGRPPGTSGTARGAAEAVWTLRTALARRAFWLLTAAGVSQALVNTALVFHHAPLMAERRVGADVAAVALGMMGPGMVAGTVAAGYLAGRVPVRVLLAGGQALLLAVLLLALGMESGWQACVYGALIGTTSGVLSTASALVWPTYFGRANLGAIQGAATVLMVAAAAAGPFPYGLLFDATGGYTLALQLSLGLPVLCALAALAAGYPRHPSHIQEA